MQKVPYQFLEPGALVLSKRPLKVATILGSCISVTMFDTQSAYGAICHGMLPINTKNDFLLSGKYVDSAINHMVNFFRHNLIPLKQLQVKLFGGGDVLSVNQNSSRVTIGQQNITAAKKLLHQYQLPLTVEHTRGDSGVKLIFFTHTGDVYLKKIKPSLVPKGV